MNISSYENYFIKQVICMKQNLTETCRLFFSTLSNPTRLAILELLRDGPKNVTEISEALNQEQSMISHNLKPLERCKFVFSERKKKERFYSLNKETMEQLFKTFAYHAEKYCPTQGKCLTPRELQKQKKKNASNSLYVTRY
jgi:DNA-binding transcriptional ArsR family regulator